MNSLHGLHHHQRHIVQITKRNLVLFHSVLVSSQLESGHHILRWTNWNGFEEGSKDGQSLATNLYAGQLKSLLCLAWKMQGSCILKIQGLSSSTWRRDIQMKERTYWVSRTGLEPMSWKSFWHTLVMFSQTWSAIYVDPKFSFIDSHIIMFRNTASLLWRVSAICEGSVQVWLRLTITTVTVVLDSQAGYITEHVTGIKSACPTNASHRTLNLFMNQLISTWEWNQSKNHFTIISNACITGWWMDHALKSISAHCKQYKRHFHILSICTSLLPVETGNAHPDSIGSSLRKLICFGFRTSQTAACIAVCTALLLFLFQIKQTLFWPTSFLE